MTFSRRLRQHARSRPTHPAIVEPERTIDYRTLDAMVDEAAHALAANGIGYATTVGLSITDGAGHVVALLALARVGAVVVPLDTRWTATEARQVAAGFAADTILSDRPSRDWREFVCPEAASGAQAYEDERVGDDTPFLVSLSSGTTGRPKDPRVTQGKFIERFAVYWVDLCLSRHDRFLTATPLYFGGGRGFTLAMLWAGGTALLMCPPYRPEALAGFALSERATATFLVPTLLQRMLALPGRQELVFPTLRVLISSGAALLRADAERVRARLSPHLYQYYSSTEGGGCTTLAPDDFAAHPTSVGRACVGVELEVVDPADCPVPLGDVGRIRYRSAASADGYFGGRDENAFRDGWFYPGDLGVLDADGFLTLRGRAKDMIIRGGVNIYPGDIEAALGAHPAVSAVAVAGMPSEALGEEVVAAVVLVGRVGLDELDAHCRTLLAPYKIPSRYTILEALPQTSGGKLDRRALADHLAAGTAPPGRGS